MANLTVDFPSGLHSKLQEAVDRDEKFKSRNEAVRYYVRMGLDDRFGPPHRLADAEPRTQPDTTQTNE